MNVLYSPYNSILHDENMSLQYTEIFKVVKKKEKKNQQKFFDIFLIFAENIDCGYT